MPSAVTATDLDATARELRALGLRLPEPVAALYGQALTAELVGLPECLAIDDLLAISGQAPSRALHALLLLLFGGRTCGSLCLSLDPAGLAAELADLAPDAAALGEAIRLIRDHSSKTLIEISGGVGLKDLRRLARLGPDRISVGRITHSAPALDIGLDLA